MMGTYIGVLRGDVKEHLSEYYDKAFDVFESYYEMGNVYRVPSHWEKALGVRTQMDWGSWLYVCDRETVLKLIAPEVSSLLPITPAAPGEELARIDPPIPFSALPDGDWYGILEAELW